MYNMTDFIWKNYLFYLLLGSQNFDRKPPEQNSSNQKSLKLKVACNGQPQQNLKCNIWFSKNGKINLPYYRTIVLDSNILYVFLSRYCIDKNYGGFLSVWDRIFGTFAEEKEEHMYI